MTMERDSVQAFRSRKPENVGNWTADTNRTSDGRIVCARCGAVAVMTSNGRWICGGMCPN